MVGKETDRDDLRSDKLRSSRCQSVGTVLWVGVRRECEADFDTLARLSLRSPHATTIDHVDNKGPIGTARRLVCM
jgi:hypothetical protein